jgi:IMP dehydrogenase
MKFAEKLGMHYENNINEHLAFDDVSLLPGRSDFEPNEADISVWITPEHLLDIPFISSPMDRVTESEMCIALAREGGLGVLHRNCPMQVEVDMAKKVKREEISGIIRDPLTVTPDTQISTVIRIMREKNISGLPVLDKSGDLVGIITNRDVVAANPDSLVSKEMTPKEKLVTTLEKDILENGKLNTEKVKQLLHLHRIEKLLVLDELLKLTGLITLKDLKRLEDSPHVSRDAEGRLTVGASISAFDHERAIRLDLVGVDILVIDIAHGMNLNAINSVKKISKDVNAWIMYGNIATEEGANEVITSDIDKLASLRVGLGGGSICQTTQVTGVGVTTLSATALVADAVQEHDTNISVVADGGIRSSGDIAKAIGAGASAVMCGYLFAGTDEAPSEKVYIRGVPMKRYRGMASPSAIRERYAVDRYTRGSKRIAEGVEGMVPYRGSVRTLVRDLASALKASYGYVGAKTTKEMWEKARFSKRTMIGVREGLPHDVIPESQFQDMYDTYF